MVKVFTEFPNTGGSPAWGNWCEGICRKDAVPELSLKVLGKVKEGSKG